MFEVYGGTVTHAGEVVHGKTSEMFHDGKGVFEGAGSQGRAVLQRLAQAIASPVSTLV